MAKLLKLAKVAKAYHLLHIEQAVFEECDRFYTVRDPTDSLISKTVTLEISYCIETDVSDNELLIELNTVWLNKPYVAKATVPKNAVLPSPEAAVTYLVHQTFFQQWNLKKFVLSIS